MFKRLSVVTALATLAACGVPDSAELGSLTEEEGRAVCEEFASDFPVRTVLCDYSGTEVEVQVGVDPSECEGENYIQPPETCTATVGENRACLSAWYELTDEEICDPDFTFPTECDTVFTDECIPA